VGIFKDKTLLFFLTFLLFMGNHGLAWDMMGFLSASYVIGQNGSSSVYCDVSTITNMTLYYQAL